VAVPLLRFALVVVAGVTVMSFDFGALERFRLTYPRASKKPRPRKFFRATIPRTRTAGGKRQSFINGHLLQRVRVAVLIEEAVG